MNTRDAPAPSVTFIPGAAGSSSFWIPIIERLPRQWGVRALDLPGLGSVPARADISSYDDLVDHVAATIETPAAIAAQSMGAYVALQLALRYPRLVTHVVLTAATGGVRAVSHGAGDWRHDYAQTYEGAASWACSHPRDLTDDELGAMTIPVLLLWATHDVLSPLSIGRELANKLPRARLVTFASEDHWFVHQHAKSVAEEICRFLVQR